jgi:Rrf2 family transcriptional regulator, iron-sulfur cluster assembly transcription factor
MQFTRKGDYALKAMVYLADTKSRGPHTIDEISESSNVPRHFLAKILKDLTRANLLIAVKGARGGYTLARPAVDINLLQIIEAVVGPLALNLCLEGDNRCADSNTCGLYPVWRQASDAITRVFENADLNSVCHGR